MKSIAINLAVIALLACVIGASSAETMEQPNKAGGKIVLTDKPCLEKEAAPLLHAYSFAPDGQALFGCWGQVGGKVHITWHNGERSVLPPNSFGPKKHGKSHSI